MQKEETEVITTHKHNQDLTEKERGKKVVEHLRKYLKLKEKDPKAAYDELLKSAIFTWWNHPLAEEWTQIVFRVDKVGKASIVDMIQRNELELQMAKDRSPYEDQITYLQGRLQFWKEKKQLAEDEGRNPNDPDIKWSIRIEDE